MVMILDAVSVLQVLATIYLIVSVPAVTPSTTPPTTTAVALLLLQPPPGERSVNVIDEPAHTLDGPAIIPAFEAESTVMDLVAVDVQVMLVTV